MAKVTAIVLAGWKMNSFGYELECDSVDEMCNKLAAFHPKDVISGCFDIVDYWVTEGELSEPPVLHSSHVEEWKVFEMPF